MNAKIQAAHAGAAGRSFSVVAEEIKTLARGSHTFNDEIGCVVAKARASVEATMEHMEKLASNDMSRTLQAKGRVDQMLTGVNQVNDQLAVSLKEISQLTDRVHEDVGNAIRSLQFEDITRQVLEYAERRIDTVTALVADLNTQIFEVKSHAGDGDSMKGALIAMSGRVQEFREESKRESEQSAMQDTMQQGEVDLF